MNLDQNNCDSETNNGVSSLPPYVRAPHHWFYRKEIDNRFVWEPFSKKDSLNLEQAFHKQTQSVLATDGGRFDVNITQRVRSAAYWDAPPNEVRRCSWFFKGTLDGRFVPYTEEISKKLEAEYKVAYELNEWHHKVDLNNGESVMFHGPDVLVHFGVAQSPDVWGNTPQTGARPRVVKRGMDEFDIDIGETTEIDHILFMVHGVGSKCDLKFRNLIEVVDDFRINCRHLVQSHYSSAFDARKANRIEVLPITWHEKLHSDETGVDQKLKKITLDSIPRLREFANDTILDIFFYLSPHYCQTIISRVGQELNRVFEVFKKRNPTFTGNVSLAGHSLGSLVLFDLLSHQRAGPSPIESEDEEILKTSNSLPPPSKHLSKRISFLLNARGPGEVKLNYPQLKFKPNALFAIGSPIGMFLTVRGLDYLGETFVLPTCSTFMNIFHPYDPVAYRMEPIVNPEAQIVRPFLIPHHKGRKRMHLELKETMVRVGADLKQKFFDSIRTTWNSLYQFTSKDDIEQIIDTPSPVNHEDQNSVKPEFSQVETNITFGNLNGGRRIDYVLQEAPVEFFNEYLFAIQSHLCYWESQDTILIILKEIYDNMGIQTDGQIPQQTMTIHPDD